MALLHCQTMSFDDMRFDDVATPPLDNTMLFFHARRYHVTLSVADDGSGRLVCTGLSQEMLYNTVVRECVLLLGLLGGLGFYVLRSTLCSTTKSKQH